MDMSTPTRLTKKRHGHATPILAHIVRKVAPTTPRMRELRPITPRDTPDEERSASTLASPMSLSPWSRFMHQPRGSKTKHVELEFDGVMNLVYDCFEKKAKVGVAGGGVGLSHGVSCHSPGSSQPRSSHPVVVSCLPFCVVTVCREKVWSWSADARGGQGRERRLLSHV